MIKIKEHLNNPKYNIIGIFLGMILSWIIGMKTDLPQSAGHGGFIPLIVPLFVGFMTILAYFIVRFFNKKYSWIISVIGILYNLYFAIDFYCSYV